MTNESEDKFLPEKRIPIRKANSYRRRIHSMGLHLLLTAGCLAPAAAADFTVINTNASGAGSFSVILAFANVSTDPTVNIHLGTYYIRHLLNSLEGNWHEALAAYNGGRTRVIKWRTFASYREPAEFIETIPFDETRGYVQAVLRNAAVYKQLYEGKAAAISYPEPTAVAAPKPVPAKPPAARLAQRKSAKRPPTTR